MPLKGAMSAQKALQGSEMEKRELPGGTKEKSVSPTGGHCPPGKSIIFHQKEREKIEIVVARPVPLPDQQESRGGLLQDEDEQPRLQDHHPHQVQPLHQ